MRTPTQQLYSVSKLIGYCESILGTGQLGPAVEENLRVRVADTISAFGLQHHDDGQYERAMNAIDSVLNRPDLRIVS